MVTCPIPTKGGKHIDLLALFSHCRRRTQSPSLFHIDLLNTTLTTWKVKTLSSQVGKVGTQLVVPHASSSYQDNDLYSTPTESSAMGRSFGYRLFQPSW